MKKKMLLEAQKRLGILLDMGLKDEITKVFDERSDYFGLRAHPIRF